MMSRIRTALSLIGFGFAIVQFFECMDQMPGSSGRFAKCPDVCRVSIDIVRHPGTDHHALAFIGKVHKDGRSAPPGADGNAPMAVSPGCSKAVIRLDTDATVSQLWQSSDGRERPGLGRVGELGQYLLGAQTSLVHWVAARTPRHDASYATALANFTATIYRAEGFGRRQNSLPASVPRA